MRPKPLKRRGKVAGHARGHSSQDTTKGKDLALEELLSL